jgi:hypothetical protein
VGFFITCQEDEIDVRILAYKQAVGKEVKEAGTLKKSFIIVK